MKLSYAYLGGILALLSADYVKAGPNPSTSKAQAIISSRIIHSGLDTTHNVDEISQTLEPILAPFGCHKWVTAQITESLLNLGISKENVHGYLRRRARDRARSIKREAIHREYHTVPRHKEVGQSSAKVTLIGEKKRAATEAALKAEIAALEAKMEELDLSFDSSPRLFIKHYDYLRGDHTINQYGRIFYALLKRGNVREDWVKKYKLAMRKRTEANRQQNRLLKMLDDFDQHDLDSPLFDDNVAFHHGSESNDGDPSPAAKLQELKEESIMINDDKDVYSTPHQSDSEDEMDNFDLKVQHTNPEGRLSRPLHDFDLPYNWYHRREDESASVLQTDKMEPQEMAEGEWYWTDTEQHESQDETVHFAQYPIVSGSERSDAWEDANDAPRPVCGGKTYKGASRPSTASISLPPSQSDLWESASPSSISHFDDPEARSPVLRY